MSTKTNLQILACSLALNMTICTVLMLCHILLTLPLSLVIGVAAYPLVYYIFRLAGKVN